MVDLDWRARRFLSRRAGSVKKSFQMLRSKARFGLSFRLLLARSQASLTSLKVSSNVRMSVCDCCIRADTSGETNSAQASESARKNNLLLFPRYLTKHYWDTVNMHFGVVQMNRSAVFAIVAYFFLAREPADLSYLKPVLSDSKTHVCGVNTWANIAQPFGQMLSGTICPATHC